MKSREISTPSTSSTLLYRPVIHILFIVILGLIVYSNTFHAPFQWDEEKFIIKNPFVKDLHYFVNLSKAEGREHYRALKNRYIGYLTFALNYKINGLDVPGYHVVNITIHLFNALLVYFLVILTFQTPFLKKSGGSVHSKYMALFSSLLFVAHPIQTEAVTYIFQRLASLVSFFYLLSVVSYLKSRLSEGKKTKIFFYVLSLASTVLAMKTKENAFTLPMAITLYEFLFFQGPLRKRLLYLIPILLTLFIIPITLLGVHKSLGEIIGQELSKIGYQKIQRQHYLFTQFRVIVTYLRLLIFPLHQNFDYDYPLYQSFFHPPVYLSFFFLLAIFGGAIYLVHDSRTGQPESRLVGFGILWFFLSLSIESSLIPIPMLINEYRVYLPSVGFLMAMVAGGFLLVKRSGDKRVQKVSVSILVGIILLFSYATYMRNSLWGDKLRLWDDVVKKSPNKANGYINRGIAFKEKGLDEKAMKDLKKAVSLKPDHVLAHYNLAVVYLKKNRLEEAIETLQTALTLKPDLAEAHSNLASIYIKQNRLNEAMKALQKALELKSDLPEIHLNLAAVYIKQNRLDEAMKPLQAALNLKPDLAEAYINLGTIYMKQNRLDEALKELQTALRLRPNLIETHMNLATIHIKKNRLDEAISELQMAIKLMPNLAEAYNGLGYIYTLRGKIKEAVIQFEHAVRLAPDNVEFRSNLHKTKTLLMP